MPAGPRAVPPRRLPSAPVSSTACLPFWSLRSGRLLSWLPRRPRACGSLLLRFRRFGLERAVGQQHRRGGRGLDFDAVIVVQQQARRDLVVPGQLLDRADRHLAAGAARLHRAQQQRERHRQPDRSDHQEQRQRVFEEEPLGPARDVAERDQDGAAPVRPAAADGLTGRRGACRCRCSTRRPARPGGLVIVAHLGGWTVIGSRRGPKR